MNTLASIEYDFFNKSPLDAIKRYYSDIISKVDHLNDPKEDD